MQKKQQQDQSQIKWISDFIWNIADDRLRDVYVRGKYRDVILPFTVLRRLDAVLEATKDAVLERKKFLDTHKVAEQDGALRMAAGQAFYNVSEFTLAKLKASAAGQRLRDDFIAYLDGFSPNVQEILTKFNFRNQIQKLVDSHVLGYLIDDFLDPEVNLAPLPVKDADGRIKLPALDNHGMGTVFEELIRRFNEDNNEEAGEHFTPRDVVQLMAKLLFLPVADRIESSTYSLYDGSCGTGGMLTVAENVWLGLDKSLSLAEVTQRITATAAEYGLDVDPSRPVHTLSVGQMQRVEIIRALLTQPQLLILDEPTSVLTPQAVERLFVVLRQLAARGCSILYISHKLHEIRALCEACTVLRGGRVTGTCDPRQEDNASLSRLMIGAEPPQLAHRPARVGEPVLEVRGLSLARESAFGTDLQDVSLQVRAGEVVGIAGVSGNGQRELLFALSGEDTRAQAGMVRVAGQDAGRFGPGRRRALGLHFVPEERLGRGAVPSLGLAHNLLLTRREALGRGGWIRMGALQAQAQAIIDRFGVRAGGPNAAARSLSGGNLQKFIVGREIDANPRLLVISQPTWGVDVGAAAQIRGEILALRDAGCAVLVVSEELDELFELSDRLHVMAKGRLSPSLDRADATVELIGEWMSGLWDRPHEEAAREAAHV